MHIYLFKSHTCIHWHLFKINTVTLKPTAYLQRKPSESFIVSDSELHQYNILVNTQREAIIIALWSTHGGLFNSGTWITVYHGTSIFGIIVFNHLENLLFDLFFSLILCVHAWISNGWSKIFNGEKDVPREAT